MIPGQVSCEPRCTAHVQTKAVVGPHRSRRSMQVDPVDRRVALGSLQICAILNQGLISPSNSMLHRAGSRSVQRDVEATKPKQGPHQPLKKPLILLCFVLIFRITMTHAPSTPTPYSPLAVLVQEPDVYVPCSSSESKAGYKGWIATSSDPKERQRWCWK